MEVDAWGPMFTTLGLSSQGGSSDAGAGAPHTPGQAAATGSGGGPPHASECCATGLAAAQAPQWYAPFGGWAAAAQSPSSQGRGVAVRIGLGGDGDSPIKVTLTTLGERNYPM